jgi:nitrate reductase gamma subunit
MKLFLAAAVVILLFWGDYMRLGSTSFKVIAVVSLSVFFLGFWNRISTWSRGGGNMRGYEIAREAIKGAFSKECFFACRLFRESKVRGIVLTLTIWAFMILTLGSICLSLEYMLKVDLSSFSAFSVLMDCSGLLLFCCIVFYLLRRVVVKGPRSIAAADDLFLLTLFLIVIVSGFAVEGLRIAYAGASSEPHSPVGGVLAKLFLSYSEAPAVISRLKDFVWKSHALCAFVFFSYIPFSKQFHMFAAQIVTRDADKRRKQLWRILHE